MTVQPDSLPRNPGGHIGHRNRMTNLTGQCDDLTPSTTPSRQPATSDEVPRQTVLFVGGSKDGQILTVPFADGEICVCAEMQPQLRLMKEGASATRLTIPVELEPYALHVINPDSRRLAVSLTLRLVHLVEDMDIPGRQIPVNAVHQLRSSIQSQVSDLGGRIAPAALGREEITVELLDEVDTELPAMWERRALRGDCWFTMPAEQRRHQHGEARRERA